MSNSNYVQYKVKDINLADWGRREIKLAEAEMIGNMTFFNMELGLFQLGNINRTIGKFVNVSNDAEMGDGDAKLCGQWLVTKCTQQLIGDEYYNRLSCVKAYLGPGSNTGAGVEGITNDC